VGFLERELRAGDLCLTLGAGDITTLPDEVMARRRAGAGGPAPRTVAAGVDGSEPAEADGQAG
jgi:hypothetical protein